MDATVASRQLAAPATEHLWRIAVACRQVAAEERPAAAEALSEAFGFFAWLAWDMYDLGSARRRYGQAVEAAREARNPTLAAYMRGSAAAFAASTGDTSRGLSLAERTGASLGGGQAACRRGVAGGDPRACPRQRGARARGATRA
jgi:hypothetical protein